MFPVHNGVVEYDPMEAGSWHEAGHAIAALYFGFVVEFILYKDGKLQTLWRPPDDRPNDVCIVLASGAAGEAIGFNGSVDRYACKSDAVEIKSRSGRPLEEFLLDAKRILKENRSKLDELRVKLDVRINNAAFGPVAGFNLEPEFDSSSGILFSKDELLNLWGNSASVQTYG